MAIINGTGGRDLILPGFNSAGGELPTGGADTINGFAGDDFLDGGGGSDNILGGSGADNLLGNSGNDNLQGDRGDDALLGGSGRDTLQGGPGNDTLLGEDGDDSLNGGSGMDVLVGGPGKERLEGGADNDTFVFSSVTGSNPLSGNRDFINGFQGGGSAVGDKIDLSNIDAIRSGDDDVFTWVTAPSSTPGELWYSRGILRGDTDGDGHADFAIELVGAPPVFVASSLGTDVLL